MILSHHGERRQLAETHHKCQEMALSWPQWRQHKPSFITSDLKVLGMAWDRDSLHTMGLRASQR